MRQIGERNAKIDPLSLVAGASVERLELARVASFADRHAWIFAPSEARDPA
jgi:hypothetical protein